MTPKDVSVWAGIIGSIVVAVAAHFGVASKADTAQRGNESLEKRLEQHLAESKEVHEARARELEGLREQHTRDVSILQQQEQATRERIIVQEQTTRQILQSLQKLEAVLEASTVVVDKRARR